MLTRRDLRNWLCVATLSWLTFALLASNLRAATYSRLNVTEDTSYGSLASGSDITAALQEAASGMKPASVGGHFRNLFCPPGVWEISDTVTFSFRAGGKFLGEGPTDPEISSDKEGIGTVFKWTGPDDGRPMFKFTGTEYELGDWTMWADGYDNAVGMAWGKPNGLSGLGTGKSQHRPIRFEGFDKCIRLRIPGQDRDENVDNLIFDVIEAENCNIIMEMNSNQNMDIWVQKLHASNCTYGFYAAGGGHLHVGHSLWTYGSQTALYIPAAAAVTWTNGKYTFDHLKVDDQSNNDFTFCETHIEYNHQVHLGHAIISPTAFSGNFATISGRGVLTIDHCSGSFKTITGVIKDGVTPVCILGDSFMQQATEDIFAGDINYRIQDNTSWSNLWREDLPKRVFFQSQVYTAEDGAVGTRTWGGDQVRYGQPQTCRYDLQGLLVKHGKTIDDVSRATFQLKRNPRLPDALADFNKNSVDHPLQVSFAMEEVTVEDGSTESHLIVTATINTADYGTAGRKLRADVPYHESCSIMFAGDSVTTYELDQYPAVSRVTFEKDRVN